MFPERSQPQLASCISIQASLILHNRGQTALLPNSTSTQQTDIQRESSLLMHLFQVVHIKRREGLASSLRESQQAKSESYAMLHLHTDKTPSTIRTTRPVPTTHHPAHIDKACTGRGRTEAH